MIEFVTGVLNESFLLAARMAPYLMLGILVAGALHVVLPAGLVARHMGKPGVGSVFRASALGVPLPLCSCGVIPVAASLKKNGASDGAVVGFLITTPTSGVDSILATYSLLGAGFAAIRVVATFIVGLVAGIVTSLVRRGEPGDIVEPATNDENNAGLSIGKRIVVGLEYGLGDLLGSIAKPLVIGTLLGGVIAYALPPGILEQYIGQGLLSYLLMLLVAIPLYVCASGSIPLAAALLAKGISPGAALIFLLAGPATNAATVAVVYRMLGRRAFTVYSVVLVAGVFLAGLATDAFFGWFPALLPEIAHHGAHAMGGLSVLELTCGAILVLASAYHLFGKKIMSARNQQDMGPDALTVKVPDMNCQHCVQSITKAVSGLDGFKDIHADPSSKLVKLAFVGAVDGRAVMAAIEDAGFHPEEHTE